MTFKSFMLFKIQTNQNVLKCVKQYFNDFHRTLFLLSLLIIHKLKKMFHKPTKLKHYFIFSLNLNYNLFITDYSQICLNIVK